RAVSSERAGSRIPNEGGGDSWSNDWPASLDCESYRRARIPFRFCDDGPTRRGWVAHRQRSILRHPTSPTRRAGDSLRAAFKRPPRKFHGGGPLKELGRKQDGCLSWGGGVRWRDSKGGGARQYAG